MSDVNENLEAGIHPDYAEERDVVTEAFMADEKEGPTKSPEEAANEAAFFNVVYQRKVIATALKNGTLSCLPGADGLADTKPAVNLVNGTYYHGANMLFLKEHQKENGFPSAEYVTSNQIDRAHADNPGIMIRKGQHGVSLQFSEQNEETGEWEKKSVRLFNIAQTTNPKELKAWAEQKQQEKLQEKLEYLQSQYGKNYRMPEPKQKGPGPEITCTSTDPEKYLGQYLAAVSLGGQFKASPEQAKEFAQKMNDSLFEKVGISQKTQEPVSNPFKLSKISNEASQYCKEVMKELKTEERKQQQEHKLEHTRSHGHSR